VKKAARDANVPRDIEAIVKADLEAEAKPKVGNDNNRDGEGPPKIKIPMAAGAALSPELQVESTKDQLVEGWVHLGLSEAEIDEVARRVVKVVNAYTIHPDTDPYEGFLEKEQGFFKIVAGEVLTKKGEAQLDDERLKFLGLTEDEKREISKRYFERVWLLNLDATDLDREAILKDELVEALQSRVATANRSRMGGSIIKGASHFGAAIFIKDLLNVITGRDPEALDRFLANTPEVLIEYGLFAIGGGIGTGIYDGVILGASRIEYIMFRQLIHKRMEAEIAARVLSEGEYGVSRYLSGPNFLRHQAGFFAALAFVDFMRTGEIHWGEVARGWLSFGLASMGIKAVVTVVNRTLIARVAGTAWELKNMSGPVGWALTAVELGLTMFFAEDIRHVMDIVEHRLDIHGAVVSLVIDADSEWDGTYDKFVTQYEEKVKPAFEAFRQYRLQKYMFELMSYQPKLKGWEQKKEAEIASLKRKIYNREQMLASDNPLGRRTPYPLKQQAKKDLPKYEEALQRTKAETIEDYQAELDEGLEKALKETQKEVFSEAYAPMTLAFMTAWKPGVSKEEKREAKKRFNRSMRWSQTHGMGGTGMAIELFFHEMAVLEKVRNMLSIKSDRTKDARNIMDYIDEQIARLTIEAVGMTLFLKQ